jgi:hypothetical protein
LFHYLIETRRRALWLTLSVVTLGLFVACSGSDAESGGASGGTPPSGDPGSAGGGASPSAGGAQAQGGVADAGRTSSAGTKSSAGDSSLSGAGGEGDSGEPARGPGTDYYCDPKLGSLENPGSAVAPWPALDQVLSAGKTFVDGDVIHLRAGNHGRPVLTGSIASGMRTIRVEAGVTALVERLRLAKGASRWTVDGLVVSPLEAGAAATSENLVEVAEGASNNVLQNLQARYATDEIAQTWDNAAWVKNSGTAIFVVGKDNRIVDNHIRNTRNGIMLERTSQDGEGATGSVVSRNDVQHFWEDAYRGKVSDCVFEYNRAVNSYAVVPPGSELDPPHRDMFQCYRGDGSFTSVDRIVMRGNVFIARQGERYTKVPFQYQGHYTIQGLSAFDGPYRQWTIENNVIMVEVGLAMGLLGMDDSIIVNNTIIPDAFGTDSELRLTDRKDGTPSKNNVVRNNLVHVLNIGKAQGTQQSNNLAVGTDHYLTFFIDQPGGDLRLKPGSPAIGAGTKTDAPPLDVTGAMRREPYDVGAYAAP